MGGGRGGGREAEGVGRARQGGARRGKEGKWASVRRGEEWGRKGRGGEAGGVTIAFKFSKRRTGIIN